MFLDNLSIPVLDVKSGQKNIEGPLGTAKKPSGDPAWTSSAFLLVSASETILSVDSHVLYMYKRVHVQLSFQDLI